MNENKRLKRLLIDVDEEYHQEVKVRAAKAKQSIREWVFQAIVERVIKENEEER